MRGRGVDLLLYHAQQLDNEQKVFQRLDDLMDEKRAQRHEARRQQDAADGDAPAAADDQWDEKVVTQV
jgi:hypothetical protein